jgi:hypothetical protein
LTPTVPERQRRDCERFAPQNHRPGILEIAADPPQRQHGDEHADRHPEYGKGAETPTVANNRVHAA